MRRDASCKHPDEPCRWPSAAGRPWSYRMRGGERSAADINRRSLGWPWKVPDLATVAVWEDPIPLDGQSFILRISRWPELHLNSFSHTPSVVHLRCDAFKMWCFMYGRLWCHVSKGNFRYPSASRLGIAFLFGSPDCVSLASSSLLGSVQSLWWVTSAFRKSEEQFPVGIA